jgi:lysozyme family protein
MKTTYEQALAWVLEHEGGFVNDPDDRGGPTNRGVTQLVYDGYRRLNGLSLRSVEEIDIFEVRAIYRRQYWEVIRGDDLPAGLDYAVFDFAVNSGPRRAAQFLQRIVGVEDDGMIGEVTLAAVSERNPSDLIDALCAARMAFLKRLSNWWKYKNGWTKRVQAVNTRAMRLAGSIPQLADYTPDAEVTPRATGQANISTQIKDNAGPSSVAAGGAVAAVAQVVTASQDAPEVVQVALAVVILLAAIVVARMFWRKEA